MQKREELFTSAPIPKTFMTFCLPVVTGMVINLLYNMVDTYFVGQLNDVNQMAAVSLCAPVFIVLMGLGNIFGLGGSSVISRLMGEKKADEVRYTSASTFWIAVGIGLVLAVLLVPGSHLLMPMLGTSENTIGYTNTYLRWIMGASPLILINFTLMNHLRCDGAASQSMMGSVLGSVVNMILDPVLILWLKLGVGGAAMATVAGYVVTCVYYIVYVLKAKGALSISPKDFKPSMTMMGDVLAIGLPASVTNILSSVSNIYLNNVLLQYGDTAIAAMGIALKISNIVSLVQIGFAGGLTPVLGYNWGARNRNRLLQLLKAAFLFAFVVGLVPSVIIYLFARQIIPFFMDTAAIVVPGTQLLRALMLCGPFLGIIFVITNFFQGTGKALPAMLLSLCRQGLLLLVMITVLQSLFGWNGIVYAQTVSDYLTLAIAVGLFAWVGGKMLRSLKA